MAGVTARRWLVLAWVCCACAQSPPTGIRNFGEVTAGPHAEAIYRGAQPSEANLKDLAAFGIQTVVNLRGDHSAAGEKLRVEALHMQFVHVPLNGLAAPTNEQIEKLMRVLETARRPIFIHCQHGSDRTSTVVACWRIWHDHWSNQKALEEAKAYHLSPFEVGMRRFISRYSPRN